MATHSETFENCEIEVTDDQIKINGKQMQPEFDPAAGKWSSQYLPYTRYDSLIELARAIVHDTEEF